MRGAIYFSDLVNLLYKDFIHCFVINGSSRVICLEFSKSPGDQSFKTMQGRYLSVGVT